MKADQLPKIIRQQKRKGLHLFFVAFFMFLLCASTRSFAAPPTDLVVNTPLCFTNMDNNPAYDDDIIPGQITLHSLIIQNGGSISYNDPGSDCADAGDPNDGAGSIKIIVQTNFEMQNGSAIYTENRLQSGKAGDITLLIGGNFLMKLGSLISSSNLTATSGDRSAGRDSIDVVGTIVMDAGSEIRANSAHGNGGDIYLISHTEDITINGFVYSKDLSNQSGSGNNQAHGGLIWIQTPKSIIEGDLGEISSHGFDAGADLVHLCGCNITIYGLVESSATGHGIPSDPPNHLNHTFRPDKNPNSTAGVEIWAASSLIIDNLNHHGQVNADLCCGGGTDGESYIDLFVSSGDLTILGKTDPDNRDVYNTNFAVHANGAAGNSDNGGTVTIKVINGKITVRGLAVQADGTKDGGLVIMEAKKDVDLSSSTVTARAYSVATTTGGHINIRSFGTAPSTGNIVADAASYLDVTGDAGALINLTACGTIAFPPGNFVPAAATTNIITGTCDGNPSLATQPYVEFCECCPASTLTITKVFNGNGNAASNPLTDWEFTITPGVDGVSPSTVFTIDKLGGNKAFTNVPAGTYTVTETLKADPSCTDHSNYDVSNTCSGSLVNSNVSHITVVACNNASCTFINAPPDCNRDPICQWCTKSAVLSQVWQNPGGGDPSRKCVVPDILVDVRLPHTADNNVVIASEIGTGIPATWSIQAAVDYANAHRNDPDPNPFKIDEIFIGVTASDPVALDPLDPNGCGKTCGRPPSGDNPYGSENVIVTNLSTVRMNIFGCSTTMHAADVNLPVFTVQGGIGKITILDLHVWNSNVAGYLVKPGNSGLVTIKNSAAYNNDLGYDVQDDNVQVSGSQHMRFNRIGALIEGSNNHDVLRTNSDITNNTEAGIKITGNNNETNGNEVGTHNFPNATGIIVTGNNNSLHDDNVSYNTGNGIYITGNNNTVHQEDANSNGLYGILSLGSGNMFDGNKANSNGKQGIRACGQVDNTGNNGSGNVEDPQVQFSCADPSTAKFSVVDISADKSYKYDPTFNLVSATKLTANNADANDAADNGTNTYVLDKSDKQVYRYSGGTASKVLKSSSGGSLSSPSGMAIDGDQLWVVDGSNKIIYRYSLAAAFAGSGTVNALQQIALTGNNGNAEGLAIDATYLYVLDNSDKVFYRYPRAGGAGVASKVLKELGGSSLGNPSGAVLDGVNMWIVDNNKDKAYKYTFANLGFGVAGNINAAAQYTLFSDNTNPTGIAVGTSANLLRVITANPADDNSTGNTVAMAQHPSILVKQALQAYPNPAHDRVLVEFGSASVVKYNLNLMDAAGKVVMSYSGFTTEGNTLHEFNISKLARGSYIVVLQKAGMQKELKKVIIQ